MSIIVFVKQGIHQCLKCSFVAFVAPFKKRFKRLEVEFFLARLVINHPHFIFFSVDPVDCSIGTTNPGAWANLDVICASNRFVQEPQS